MADQEKTTKGRTKQSGSMAGQGSTGNIASEHPGSISIAGAEPSSNPATGPISGGAGPITTAGVTSGSTNVGGQSPGATGGTSSMRGTSSSTGGGSGAATATARTLIDQAKETAGQAYDAVTERAASTLDERKTTVSTGLTAVADSLRQAAGSLSGPQGDNQLASFAGRYTGTASQKLNDVARYFENTDVRGMVRDVEGYARRNPAVFIGAAFGLGLLAARFLKSTPPNNMAAGRGRNFESNAARAGSFGDDRTTGGTTGSNPGTTMPNPM